MFSLDFLFRGLVVFLNSPVDFVLQLLFYISILMLAYLTFFSATIEMYCFAILKHNHLLICPLSNCVLNNLPAPCFFLTNSLIQFNAISNFVFFYNFIPFEANRNSDL